MRQPNPDPKPHFARIRDSVEDKIARRGPQTLVGYDANGIQAFVTRTTALPYMRGASALVKAFDRETLRRHEHDCLFAAGGRGRLLVPGRPEDEAVQSLLAKLRNDFGHQTHGEVLAVAAAPFDPVDQRRSMLHLALALDIAKDEAPPPAHTAPSSTRPADRCELCRQRPKAAGKVWHRPSKGVTLAVCNACHQIMRRGASEASGDEERGLMLEDLSETNRVAVLAADGNQMGALFAGLTSLADSVIASRAVAWIFTEALDEARLDTELDDKRSVAPVVGGDDIRLFAGPERIFDCVTALVTGIERRADALAADPDVPSAIAHIGVGIGLLIAPDTYPASLAIEHAHDLESSAKTLCKPPGASPPGHRSAIDFILMRSGSELVIGGSVACHPMGISSFAGAALGDRLAAAREGAAALRLVPTSQRAILLDGLDRDADIAETPDPIFLNLLRYQVARSKKWQQWYGAMGHDWIDGATLAAHAPTHAMLEIARLGDVIERTARKGSIDD